MPAFDVEEFLARMRTLVEGLPQDATPGQIDAALWPPVAQAYAQALQPSITIAPPSIVGLVPELKEALEAAGGDVLHRIESFETIYSIAQAAYGDASPASVAKITQDPRNDGITSDWDTTPTGRRIWIPA